MMESSSSLQELRMKGDRSVTLVGCIWGCNCSVMAQQRNGLVCPISTNSYKLSNCLEWTHAIRINQLIEFYFFFEILCSLIVLIFHDLKG